MRTSELRESKAFVVWSRRGTRTLTYGVLIVVAIVMLYPFWSMLMASLHSQTQYVDGHGWSLQSWTALFQSLPVVRELLNSTLLCVGSIILILIVSLTAGFALGTLRFRASGLVFLLVISAMMVPVQSMIIPEFVNLARLGFIDQYYGAILVYTAVGIPFATFLLTAYFRRLPEDVIEAALMDGLGYGKIFIRIMVPMALPAIATIIVLQFIQIWDDLLIGLLFLQTPQLRPITVGLATLSSQHGADFPLIMAGSLLSALPAVAVYLFFQRYLISGLTMGMSK